MKSNVIIPTVGVAPWLKHHVSSIVRFSPETSIHVLHDGPAKPFLDGVVVKPCNYLDISLFKSRYNRFLKVWNRHLPHDEYLGGPSFLRHFAASEYALSVGIVSYWLFDWDVLVLFDLSEGDMIAGNAKGIRRGGNVFVKDVQFADSYLESWLTHPMTASASGGNHDQDIECNLEHNDSSWSEHFIDSQQIAQDGTCFDGNLATAYPGFEIKEGSSVDNGSKVLEWRQVGNAWLPFGFNTTLNRWVRFRTLHCWGCHKHKMEHYLNISEHGPK